MADVRSFEVFSFSIMKSSFCFTDVEIIAVQATGFVNYFRFFRTIQAVLVWKERFDEAIREKVVHSHRLVHTRMRDRTRVHIKSIVGKFFRRYRSTRPPSSVGFGRTEISVQY